MKVELVTKYIWSVKMQDFHWRGKRKRWKDLLEQTWKLLFIFLEVLLQSYTPSILDFPKEDYYANITQSSSEAFPREIRATNMLPFWMLYIKLSINSKQSKKKTKMHHEYHTNLLTNSNRVSHFPNTSTRNDGKLASYRKITCFFYFCKQYTPADRQNFHQNESIVSWYCDNTELDHVYITFILN